MIVSVKLDLSSVMMKIAVEQFNAIYKIDFFANNLLALMLRLQRYDYQDSTMKIEYLFLCYIDNMLKIEQHLLDKYFYHKRDVGNNLSVQIDQFVDSTPVLVTNDHNYNATAYVNVSFVRFIMNSLKGRLMKFILNVAAIDRIGTSIALGCVAKLIWIITHANNSKYT